MNIPNELKYTDSHEWIRVEADGVLTVGITDHAQDALGDLVYVELPEVGLALDAKQDCVVLESVKAASDAYAPVAGEIVAINQEVADHPERLNEAPYEAWLFKLKPKAGESVDALLDATAYAEVIGAA